MLFLPLLLFICNFSFTFNNASVIIAIYHFIITGTSPTIRSPEIPCYKKNKWRDLKELVSDYKIHLLQVTHADNCFFQHPDVQGFFELCQLFYKQDIESILSFYEKQSFSTELGLAVGAVTGSKELIQYASQAEQKGDTTMEQWQCITDWENKCERKGELKCVPLLLQAYKDLKLSKETALEKITQDFSLSTEEAADFMEKCW